MRTFTLSIILVFLCGFYSQVQPGWLYRGTIPGNPNINSISAVNSMVWVACDGGKVFRSMDGGSNWINLSSDLPVTDLYGIDALNSSNCWVGTGNGSIYRTSNGGLNWVQQISIPGSFINGIHMFDINTGIFTGDPTGNGQPYQNRYTTNGGANWVLPAGVPIGNNEYGVINAWDFTDQNHIWIGSANLIPNATTSNIYSTSTGFTGTWNTSIVTGTGSSAGLYYQAIAFTSNLEGMAGSNGGNLVRTTDGGQTWQPANNPPGVTTFSTITMAGAKDGLKTIHLCINEPDGYHLYTTHNFGGFWLDESLPTNAAIQDIDVVNWDLAWAGGDSGIVLSYFGPTSILNQTGETPSGYSLSQNYPNPFNPSTRITFSIPRAGFVTLKVYDNLGREVSNLVNESLQTGAYEYEFNGESLESGVYFYKLQADDFTETRKMLLIK